MIHRRVVETARPEYQFSPIPPGLTGETPLDVVDRLPSEAALPDLDPSGPGRAANHATGIPEPAAGISAGIASPGALFHSGNV